MTSDIGAPPVGVAPWHVEHARTSAASTSHGRAEACGVRAPASPGGATMPASGRTKYASGGVGIGLETGGLIRLPNVDDSHAASRTSKVEQRETPRLVRMTCPRSNDRTVARQPEK